MAYDTDLADRLRSILSGEPDVVEKRMFGGLAFLVAGHLAVSASSQGGLLLRVDPASSNALTSDPRVSLFEMRGRSMAGWLHVDIDGSVTGEELTAWVKRGVAMVRSLPPR
ncbi:MAG: hypothetical protein AVDCRST_MAG61-3270 [uncultured Friedmanniella sp.]|uniref:TfoX N-terminal domain-containing protein n=1 Tax=uncultured Friedmanniella sp. TaxID=335381 RepID=A0A6J4LRN5_9ACTN|nr:TfoX/Sxy family protein [uncultured Friedmanniella sp.]CAA9338007.1 MAG: hypothetical protein AVDCRST_MAG61-3270 [uncultured Friedmanniella sp.]